MYLILPTKYSSTNELKLKLFLQTIKNSLNHEYIKKIIVVDSSNDKIYNYLKITLNNKKIVLLKEEEKSGSIKEGIKYVLKNFGENNILAFQEPEKENMIYHYKYIIEKYSEYEDYICVPKRLRISLDSYPIEQKSSELFINHYLKNLTNLDIDWSFGPIVFTGKMSKYWLKNDVKLWDYHIPIYDAYLNKENIYELGICFMYPDEQKKEEEYNIKYIENMRIKLNYIIENVLKYKKENVM